MRLELGSINRAALHGFLVLTHHGFVSKYAVDGEIFFGSEPAILIGQLVQHLCRDGCSVCA